MHWPWKNFPTSLNGQFAGKEKTTTLVLEAVATHNTWIWHCFFGTPGALNNLNVLDKSTLIENLLRGKSWGVEFELEGHQYKYPYYLVDGIYPKWSNLIQSKRLSGQDRATKHFTKRQESVRKDIEQTFGIPQGQFQILVKPAYHWYPADMASIMKTCVILHNIQVY
jgi:hypothetical protein